MSIPFAPGVEVLEKDAFPTIQNPGATVSAVVVRSERGRDDIVTLLSNLEQYELRYGGAHASHPYGWETVRDYFDEGGVGLYVVRVLGSGATKSSKVINSIDSTLSGDSTTVQASSEGTWADSTPLTTQKYKTKLTADPGGAGLTFVVDSVTGMEVGDVVHINNGTITFTAIIASIVVGTKTVTVMAKDATGAAQVVPAYANFATVDAVVTSTTTHKAKTTISAALTVASPTQITVANAATIDKGALLFIIGSDGLRCAEVRVSAKNGNILSVTTVTTGGSDTIPSGSQVVSVNFDLLHQVDGETSVFQFLNLESADTINYVNTVLGQSEFLRSTAGTVSGGAYRAFEYPEAISSVFLAGGADGSAPLDTDFLGTNTGKTYTHGLDLLKVVKPLPQFGIPAASAVVQQGAIAFTELRGDTVFVPEAPLAADTLDELLAYRNVTLNAATSYSALYGPWLVEADALTPGGTVNIPPTGKVLGTYSETALRRGTQKPPSNEPLNGVLDVTAAFSEAEFASLNGAGVNLIRNTPGRGIRIASSRTLWPNADRKQFVNVRRILNAVKIGLEEFGANLVQEPNDDLLWRRIEAEGQKFLEGLWRQGWFFPRNDPAKAFFFQCNRATNTESLRLQAIVRAVAGVNPVLPGEKIRFELALFSGGVVNVNEL